MGVADADISNRLVCLTCSAWINLEFVSSFADPPEVISVSDVSLIAAGEDGVLECSVDANPAPADMITWHRADWGDVSSSSSRVSTFTRNGTSYLTVHNASRTDSGQFQCRADNGVGRATATAALLVKRERVKQTYFISIISSLENNK